MSLEGAIAATRFGLGARAGEIDLASGDPAAWLTDQLTPVAAGAFPDANLPTSKEGLITLQSFFQARRDRRRGSTPEFDASRADEFRREIGQAVRAEVTARSTFGAATLKPFHERLVRFWSNHFTVSATDAATSFVAGAYEREAIRPNILGSFADLALAAILHPAMLVYLDNWQSIGPGSRGGRGGRRGLNENLAREAMELHTVTPAAGYTQDDVTEFARALTGWTVGNRRIGQDRRGEVLFSNLIHEPGARTVLGRRYGGDGADQATAIIRDLAARPETGRNIGFKLARHFIADNPPTDLVVRLERTFLDTGGDLMALYSALIAAPEAWRPEAEKVKTPDELLTSTARLLGLRAAFAGDPRGVFESLAQRPLAAPSPKGWPDEAAAWIGPDALSKRIEWANRVAERAPTVDARERLEVGLGPRIAADTMIAVARAESGRQALAIALLSPDFQRR